MATAFSMEFTPRELSYLLFKKKICPKCGGKMTKQRCSEIVDGRKMYTSMNAPLYAKRREVRHDYYLFVCDECSEKFTLTDLAK